MKTQAPALLLCVVLICPSVGVAQTPEFFGEEHRKSIYEASRKTHTSATLWTLVFPGFGNIYAEDYLTGGIVGMLMVFSATIFAYGLLTDQSDILLAGGLGAAGAYVGGGVTANFAVYDYNQELRRGLKVEALKASPGLALRFSF